MSSPTFNSTSSRYKTFLQANDDPRDIARIDLHGHIPGHHNIMNPANDGSGESKLKCCCGRPDCAYLEHNNAAVDDIERKLERAAQLGQVRAFSRLAVVCQTLYIVCVVQPSNLYHLRHTFSPRSSV